MVSAKIWCENDSVSHQTLNYSREEQSFLDIKKLTKQLDIPLEGPLQVSTLSGNNLAHITPHQSLLLSGNHS